MNKIKYSHLFYNQNRDIKIKDSKVTKKPVGNDIREGKKSLPILLAIRKARGKDKQKILKVFGKSNAYKEKQDILMQAMIKCFNKIK